METPVRSRLESAVVAAMGAWCERDSQWGRDDCALACAQPIIDVLGYDPAKDFRGRYRTRIGAKRAIGEGGLPRAIRKAARRHKWRKIKPADAEPGDIGIAMMATPIAGVTAPVTVICRAPGWFVARNEDRGYTGLESKFVRIAFAVI